MANGDEDTNRRNNFAVLSMEKRTQVFITVLGVLLAAYLSVLWSTLADINGGLVKLDEKFSGLDDEMHKSAIIMTEVKEHVYSHDLEKDIWVARILSNVDAIDDLRNNVSARQDPFSGTEGRELGRRIRALELCCGVLRIDSSNGLSSITDE